jgi:phage protein D
MNQGIYPSPNFEVTLDGKDLTAKFRPRLIDLTLTESRENEADQLDINLDDSDGLLVIPTKGAKLTLSLGWRDGDMIDKGTFIVDEIEHAGAPDTLTLRARSAEFHSPVRTKKSRSFHEQNLGTILRTIANDNRLALRISSKLASTHIPHIDQTNESDVHFLNRLGKQFDAVATVKKDRLLFLSINAGKNAKGDTLPQLTVSRKDGDKHRYHSASRDAYSGVRAQWHNATTNKENSELVGSDTNPKRMRHIYANQANAERAAKAEWQRIQRGEATLQFDFALARPDIAPMMAVQFPDLKEPIGELEWLIVKATHSLSSSGFTTSIEAESKHSEH